MSEKAPDMTALSPAQVARILSVAGGRAITEEMIRADIEAGAPANAGGTIHLVHFAAWLVRKLAHHGD